MEIVARSKFVRISPRKLRLVAKEIQGLSVNQARDLLENWNKKAARTILLTLKQGVGNAVNNYRLRPDSLKIKSLQINEGPRYKRMDKSHRSFRWGTIRKKTAHIRLTIEGEEEKIVKSASRQPKSAAQKPRRLSLKRKVSKSNVKDEKK